VWRTPALLTGHAVCAIEPNLAVQAIVCDLSSTATW